MKKYNILGILTSIVFFLVFFVWGTKGKFWTVFTAFYPRFHYTALVVFIIVLAAIYIIPNKSMNLFEFIIRHRYKIFPFLGFLFCALISIFVFDSIPHVIDAAHFLWTARIFLETGSFHIPSSELYEYYQNTFNMDVNGRYFSLFLPGFSIFLAPFEFLGISYLFTPICNGIAVFLLGKIAEKQFDERVSLFAMVFGVFSSFYLFMGASYMTHTFNLVLTLLPIYLILYKSRPIWFLAAGFIASILLFIRPQNAMLLYVSLMIFMLLKNKKFKDLVLLTIPFGVTGLLLMYYNYFYTGHPLLFAQDIYFSIREPYEHCHRLGLGKGCPNTEGDYLPAEGLTMKYAFWVAFTRITLMNFNLSGHPLIFIFIISSFLFAFRKSFEIALFFIILFTGYYFFYLPGNLFGPRYLAETASLLFIPAGFAFFKMFDSKYRVIKALTITIPLTILIFLSTTIMPVLIEQFSGDFWGTDREMEKAIERENIKNSIVFIPEEYASVFLNLMDKPPYDRHGNLILADLGKENNFAVAYYMEKRDFEGAYVIDYYESIEHRTAITPLYEAVRDSIWFEFEDKRLPRSGMPDYGVNFAQSEEIDKKFYPVKQISIDVSEGSVFAMRFSELNEKSYYDFSHPILDSGIYEITLYFVSDFCGNEFNFSIDGTDFGIFNSYSAEQTNGTFTITQYLERGSHTFKLTPLRKNTCLMIDAFKMELAD
ncbi:MAG TPA: hypothetical protein PKG52_03020 [bacterium]|nr:hypothetical protein [bacterium]